MHINIKASEPEMLEVDPALDRVAERIFRRHLNEGNPISVQQAREDAKRAMDAVAIRIAAVKHQED